VSSLQKAKDEACKELEKVDSQIEVRLELVTTGEEELQQLQMQLQALQPNSIEDAKSSIIVEMKL
jgi:peptidoglycan hydrolase CwlO-like protein